jgi:HrpA-like RNA helicase
MDQPLTQELLTAENKYQILPISQFRTIIMQAIHDYQVLIIQRGAGSSKTSTYSFNLTQYLSIPGR